LNAGWSHTPTANQECTAMKTVISIRNLKYMAKFAKTYPDFGFVQTVSAQISWSHNTALLDKVKDSKKRTWYAKKTAEDGWTLSTLEYHYK
jgi:hypothetical protein